MTPASAATSDLGTLLVTGASRGIGAAIARAAARQGWAVVVNFVRDAAAADQVVRDITAAGGQAQAVQADVSRDEEVQALFIRADGLCTRPGWGPLRGLVNNAGVVDVAARLDSMDAARWQRMFAANVFSALACSREAVRRMSSRHGGNGGVIVNMSSAAARLGSPGQYVDYAAAKGAIDTFTLGLAREVADEGVRVCAVRPGIIDTDIHASGGDPDRVARVAQSLPMRRAGRPEEVADAVVWLLSPQASYSTGAVLDVTGGR